MFVLTETCTEYDERGCSEAPDWWRGNYNEESKFRELPLTGNTF